ncbi:Cadherin domain protein [anaerobic digester metagenome]
MLNQSFAINENIPAHTIVGNIVASDPDAGQTLTYTIISGNTNNAFALNPNTGALSVNNSDAIDFETNPFFNLMVRVTDNGEGNLWAEAQIAITVIDVNEAPVMLNQSFTIEENPQNHTLVGKIEAYDPDANSTIRFQITDGDIDHAFWLDTYSGELFVNNNVPIDYETNPFIVLTVEARDEHFAITTANITIVITNVNEAPWAPNFSFYVNSTVTNGDIVGTIIGSDPDENQTLKYEICDNHNCGGFRIDAITGVITIQNISLIRAAGFPMYTLMIRMTDNGSPSLDYVCYAKIQFVSLHEVTAKSEEKTNLGNGLKVYPNPSPDGKFNVSFEQEQDGKTSLYLFDLSGRLVWETNSVSGSSLLMDINGEGKGSYILKSINGYQQTEVKILLQ